MSLLVCILFNNSLFALFNVFIVVPRAQVRGAPSCRPSWAVLVHGYLRIDPDLVLPDVRAAIEMFCDLIAKGEASKQQVRIHSVHAVI